MLPQHFSHRYNTYLTIGDKRCHNEMKKRKLLTQQYEKSGKQTVLITTTLAHFFNQKLQVQLE